MRRRDLTSAIFQPSCTRSSVLSGNRTGRKIRASCRCGGGSQLTACKSSVFLRRNILDVALHELKHESVPGYDDCQSRRHEASCAQLRRSATMHASVPKVLELLNRYAAEDDTMVAKLNGLRVLYYNASYEELYGLPDADDETSRTRAWQRLLEWLGVVVERICGGMQACILSNALSSTAWMRKAPT